MRNINPVLAAEYAGDNIEPAFLIEMFFDEGTLRLWTGIGNIEWRSETYTGAGSLIGFSGVEETEDMQAKGIVVTLNGIPSSLVALALTNNIRGRRFNLYIAAMDNKRVVATEDDFRVLVEQGEGYVLVESQFVKDPYRLFAGLMDVMEFADDGNKANISLSVENILIIGKRAKERRYTDEDQRAIYPNDRGLQYINQLQDKSIVW